MGMKPSICTADDRAGAAKRWGAPAGWGRGSLTRLAPGVIALSLSLLTSPVSEIVRDRSPRQGACEAALHDVGLREEYAHTDPLLIEQTIGDEDALQRDLDALTAGCQS
ncbi:hypothetical protein M446_1802 [Methylobacterium sp. 4-46]|nr:hypothetical protein M446_1802 [Methylobacterium sp. 4-46]